MQRKAAHASKADTVTVPVALAAARSSPTVLAHMCDANAQQLKASVRCAVELLHSVHAEPSNTCYALLTRCQAIS
jgi:hypothetical protein